MFKLWLYNKISKIVFFKMVKAETETADNINGTSVDMRINFIDIGLLDSNSSKIAFDYRVDGASEWIRTDAVLKNTTGIHSLTVSSLDPDTTYEFRGLILDDINPNFIYIAPNTKTFTTLDVYVETPTLTVEGEPSSVPETPELDGGAFSVHLDSDTHIETDWEIVRTSDSVIVFSENESL